MNSEQTCPGQTGLEQKELGQLNLKEICPEQMGSGQKGTTPFYLKVNALQLNNQ